MAASRHQQYSCLCLQSVEVICTCSLSWIFYVQAATQTQVLTGVQQASLCTFPLNYHFTSFLFYLSKWIIIRINMTCLRHFKQTVDSMDHPVLFIFTSLTTSLFLADIHAYTYTFLCVSISISISTSISIPTSISISISIYINASLYICKYIHIYTCTHTEYDSKMCLPVLHNVLCAF